MVRPRVQAPTVSVAEEQGEYKTLVAARVTNALYGAIPGADHNTLLLCFRPDDAERAALAAGDDLYVALLTFGGPLQPVLVLGSLADACAVFDLTPED
jgi:hypothetical protein